MCTFREVTVTLSAAEVMVLVPLLDQEIAYQNTYAGKSTVGSELKAVREKISPLYTNILVNGEEKEETPDLKEQDRWLFSKLRRKKK